jgi:hypothetical protein
VQRVPAKAGKVAGRSESDPQQDSVYRWEGEWRAWNRAEFTLAECRAAINWACSKYDVGAPPVRQHNTKEYPWYDVKLHAMSFSAKGKNAATCLHEAAHLIAYDYFGDRIQDHGPTFLGIYMWLLEAARVAPRVALHATARSHGLKWRVIAPQDCK